jgi:NADH dehydrogenase FAD-containing subunit
VKVVILGGGFCGATLAKKLEKKGGMDVTLVDENKSFEYTPGLPRVVVEPEYKKQITLPFKNFLEDTRVVKGVATKVTPGLVNTRKDVIGFDVLAVCTGSVYPVPFKQKNVFSVSRLKDAVSLGKTLGSSDKVLVVGGGLVGTEVAAEIVSRTDKKVFLVHSKQRLLERNPVKASFFAEKFLKDRGAKLFLRQKIVKALDSEFTTSASKKINADVCVWCGGIAWDNSFTQGLGSVLDEKNALKVDGSLKLEGHSNVFVGGDANNVSEEKTAQNAERQADCIAKNLQAENPVPYEKKEGPLVISLGKKHGVLVYKNRVLTGRLPGIAKGFVREYVFSGLDGFLSKVF